ncbi:hypothetical protein D5S18_07930 [Nocardia panacis]|uniref:DUF8175 domain-containing protein n=1 Tax=Nocardia panacis TaxID=2340916 RepID=A0A3A4KVY9_9NOCA|nr:hypothetical protein [Nocardia panacis]RJO77654.1 hypothetical protein D5S18_07930 [Nocardia panacis]
MNTSHGRIVRSKTVVITLAALALTTALIAALIYKHAASRDISADPPQSVIPSPDVPVGDGFGTPVTDVYGRRVDIPAAAAGRPLPQTASPVSELDPLWLSAPPLGTTGRGGWQRVYGVSVPFSTSDGPTHISNGMAAGFAHTPRGAALAAVYISHQLGARPADPAVVARVNYSPEDLNRYHERVAAGRLPMRQPEQITRWITAPDAYQIVSWSPDLCVLMIATRAKTGTPTQIQTWTAARYAAVWTGRDWNLLPGTEIGGTREITSILGWTPW